MRLTEIVSPLESLRRCEVSLSFVSDLVIFNRKSNVVLASDFTICEISAVKQNFRRMKIFNNFAFNEI